jgi:radical SAM superfamily enzyme YgiQ (UPF0313 family)
MRVFLILPRVTELKDKLFENSILTDLLKRSLGVGRTNLLPPVQLLSIAAVTPPWVDFSIIDERIQEIPFDDPVDLVGITVTTRAAPHAYEIAEEFRLRGVPVVMGGIHPTVASEEVLGHSDSIVMGEGESVWPQVLANCREGRMERSYVGRPTMDLGELPPLPRRLLDQDDYLTLKVVSATRGCPNSCTFCSAGSAVGKRYRVRPVQDVVRELEDLPGRFTLFLDDNLGWDREYTKQLFRALIPLGLKWIGEMSLSAIQDQDLIDLAADSGCLGLGLGFESLSPTVISSIRKHRTNDPATYGELVDRVHERGIAVEGYFIVGFDEEGPEAFEPLVEFIQEAHIEAPNIHTLIPYPGTQLFRQYEREDRLLHRNWAHYDSAAGFVVYRPRKMSMDELREGYLWAKERVFSRRSIFKRLAGSRTWRAAPLTFHFNRQWRRQFQAERAVENAPPQMASPTMGPSGD